VGSALDPEAYMGPVVSAAAKAKIEKYISIGVAEGSRLVLDGRNPEVSADCRQGYFVGPTIFADVTPCRTIAKEEIFGPVVSVMKISGLDDVLELIHNQAFGNGACIFTQNLYYTEKFISEAEVGMIGVNVGVPAPHPYLPFGGIKDSHLGTNKVQGKDGIDFFTQNKIATIRFAPPSGSAAKAAAAGGAQTGAGAAKVRSCVAS
jgi:malonate-semialdehyde dehydrogenase (acetylating)/methylmalonate-semialdehyde dehydrogenase